MAKKVPDNIAGFHSFGDLIGLTFTKWETGYSQCTLEVQDKLLNPHKAVHGGAVLTMADSSTGATLYYHIDDDELC